LQDTRRFAHAAHLIRQSRKKTTGLLRGPSAAVPRHVLMFRKVEAL
jgi:hypothetical protein